MALTTIPDTFGSGGANIAPGGSAGTPVLRDILRELQAAVVQPTLTVYDNGTRPDAATLEPGTMIYNSDDEAPNFVGTDGDWHDAMGAVT